MHLSLLAAGNTVPKGRGAEASVVARHYLLSTLFSKSGCHFIEARVSGGGWQKSFPTGLTFSCRCIIHIEAWLYNFFKQNTNLLASFMAITMLAQGCLS